MNCDKVTSDLVALLYDELNDQTKKASLRHIESCQACRCEWEELRAGRELLNSLDRDSSGVDECRVDIDQLYVTTARESAVGNRRWRRVNVAIVAASLLLFCAAALQIRMTVDRNQVTIGWGNAEKSIEGVDPSPQNGEQAAAQQLLESLQRIEQLETRLDLAVTHVEQNQVRQDTVLASLESELNQVRRREEVRWRTTNLARQESSQELAAVRHAVDGVFARLNQQTNSRSFMRPQRGG